VHHHGRYNSIRYLSFSSLVAFRYDFTNAGFSIDACRFCKRFRDFGLILHRLFASNTLIILFIIGGLTAVIAQFTKLLQVNVKQN
jgi:hypothetical protein